MKWTVGKKIGAGFLGVLILVILMSVFTYWKIGEITASYQEFNNKSLEQIEMAQGTAADIANEAVVMRRFNFVGDPGDIPVYNDYKAKTAERLKWLEANIDNEQAKKDLAIIKKEKTAYEAIAEKSMAAKSAGSLDEVSSYMAEAGKPYKATLSAANELIKTTKAYVKQEQETYAAAARHSQLILITVNLIVIIVSFLIAGFVARGISVPVRKVAAAAHKISDGELTVPPIDYTSEDEIGELAAAFNKMQTSLNAVIRQVLASSEQLSTSSEGLTANAEQVAQAAAQASETITDLAHGTKQQQKDVNTAVDKVEKVTDAIQTIAMHIKKVSDVSKSAAAAADQGGKAIAGAIHQMAHIQSSVIASADVVTKLGERSKAIGQIVDTISSLAGQTNLLALNAAIEAASAGEHGKGFAVVAEEVRRLAEQSQDASEQIGALLHEIQAETGNAVAAMGNGTEEVKSGTAAVNAAGQSFDEILQNVSDLSGEVQNISSAITHIAESSSHIVTAIRQIEAVTTNATNQTESVSAASQQQTASMQEIAASSEALSTMATNLKQIVAKFKI
jgi:methyl-accepting chemotaxis protein